MDARSEAKLNMYRSVQLLFEDNGTIVATNAAFLLAANGLKANIAAIIGTTSLQGQVITGIATDKKMARKKLCRDAADIAALISAYATTVNDNTLKESVSYTYSRLFRLKDDMLPPIAQNIHNAASDNLSALAAYGISAATLAHFRSAINGYSGAVPKTRTARAVKETYSSNLGQLIKRTDALLKEQLDKMICIFKTSHPDLVTSYHFARMIIDPRRSATQVKGNIIDKRTGEIIIGAQVQVADGLPITTTDTSGNYILKPLRSNTYSITIAKTGYHTQTIEYVRVKLGKATTLNIQL